MYQYHDNALYSTKLLKAYWPDNYYLIFVFITSQGISLSILLLLQYTLMS